MWKQLTTNRTRRSCFGDERQSRDKNLENNPMQSRTGPGWQPPCHPQNHPELVVSGEVDGAMFGVLERYVKQREEAARD